MLDRPAIELGALVRAGEVSARELVEASLAAIDALDGDLNAFTLVDADGALAAADSIEAGDPRPFAGVPIAIKDLGAAVTGLVLTNGSDLFADFRQSHDSHAVRRLRGAGFVIVGKTAAPELGITPVTEPRRFGPTRNPWDLSRTPGGSSGGSGAAVAAGIVPVAHASDGGGSIRIPAACCGLVGLKPSRGRISRGPEMGDSFLATDGVLTRTVADTAHALDALEGYEPGDATWAPSPAEPFARTAERGPGRLRIGVALDPAFPAEVDADCARAAREAAELLASLGHFVADAAPPYRGAELWEVFTDAWAAFTSSGVVFGGLVRGREATRDDVEPLTWALHQRALALPSSHYLVASSRLQRHARELVEFQQDFDVLLTPALAQRPLPIGAIDPCAPEPMREFAKSGAFTPYTAVWNVTGQPAVSLPLFQGDDGLPLAVQLVGPPLGEGVLLALAAQLEAARPWAGRRPPIGAATPGS